MSAERRAGQIEGFFCGIVFTLVLLAVCSNLPPTKSEPITTTTPAEVIVEIEQPVDTFQAVMRAIAMMESSGGTNQKPNVDGIVGIGQVEKCFYQDAKEHWQRTGQPEDFPSYEDLRGYDEAAFQATCTVARYWFKRYKADTPYLMFARYRKGPRGEQTETGRAYAEKALGIMETYLKEQENGTI